MTTVEINPSEHTLAESTGILLASHLQGEALIEHYREGQYDVWYKEGNFCYSHIAPEYDVEPEEL